MLLWTQMQIKTKIMNTKFDNKKNDLVALQLETRVETLARRLTDKRMFVCAPKRALATIRYPT